jgi:hypothetical protein
MEVVEWIEVIKNLGFPVAVAVAMGWFVLHQNRSHKEERKEMREATEQERKDVHASHKEERSRFMGDMKDDRRAFLDCLEKVADKVQEVADKVNILGHRGP